MFNDVDDEDQDNIVEESGPLEGIGDDIQWQYCPTHGRITDGHWLTEECLNYV